MTLAKIEDIRRLATRVKDNWAPCKPFDGTEWAAEAEMMVAQTLHACVNNYEKVKQAQMEPIEPFSFRGDVDNGTAYTMLLDREYFTERTRDGQPIILATQKLVDYLDSFFARQKETAP